MVQTASLVVRPMLDRKAVQIGSGVVILTALGLAGFLVMPRLVGPESTPGPDAEVRTPVVAAVTSDGKTVRMTLEQQKAIGLGVEVATEENLPIVLRAPGRVTPDESRFAYITPRAAGIVRSVSAQIGQQVQSGDVLATVDSESVGQARLQLITNLQTLEVANAQAKWEQVVYQNTLELVNLLEQTLAPSAIHERFQGRPVGDNRERLITAYAKYRMAQASLERNKMLQASDAVSMAKYQEVLAEQEAAQATYQSLMDEMKFESRLALTRALQAQRQAETSVRIARERLRILGASTPSDTALPSVGGAKPPVQSSAASETTGGAAPDVLPNLDAGMDSASIVAAVMPSGGQLASTYTLTAPFDGIVLDRELVVPGIAVDETHRIFTLADLSAVWVEVNIYESDFAELFSSRDAEVRIETPAYPDRVFRGQVLYTGDLVNEKSSSIRLLARADNPDRALKPGMFVEIALICTSKEPSVRVPSSAILTEDDASYVYVQTGQDMFEKREVVIRPSVEGSIAILKGVRAGETVVTKESFKLKAEAARIAASES